MLRSRYTGSEPILTSLSELDDVEVVDVSLGVVAGPGERFRVLERMRGTLREGVRRAGVVASALATTTREAVLDPQRRPSAVRVSQSNGCILLDYDVGVVEEGGRPRSSRPMRLMMVVKDL